MDYGGRSLDSLLRDSPSSVLRDREGMVELELVKRILYQSALGLSAIHQCGIIHRDIKPANVLMDEDGRVRVTDFGLARGLDPADRYTEPGNAPGTPHYMSPEQIRGQGFEQSDIWGFGVLAYQLLTTDSLETRVPFFGYSAADLLRQSRKAIRNHLGRSTLRYLTIWRRSSSNV